MLVYGRALVVGGAAAVMGLAVPAVAWAQRVVYLNLDSTALVNTNGQDPTTNSYSSTGFTPGTIDGWNLAAEDRALLLHWFKEATVPFDIVFVDERPANGTYDMLVFGTEADNTELFDIGCSASIGLADCEDTSGPNIGFMFYGCIAEAQQADMRRVAFYGLTGLGFGWGLENVSASGEVMGSYTLSGLEFGEECTAISGTSMCTHVGCAAAQQNSSADLDARIGARVDDGPPVVAITSPMDHTVVQSDVTIDATVTDAFGGVGVELEIVEVGQTLADDVPPYSWDLAGVPDGTWTIRVTATDADANVTMQEIAICVGVEDCDEGAGSEDGTTSGGAVEESSSDGADESTSDASETSTGTAAESTGPAGTDDGIDPTATPLTSGGFGDPEAQTGCGCASDRSTSVAGLALVLLLARRRRQAASSGAA